MSFKSIIIWCPFQNLFFYSGNVCSKTILDVNTPETLYNTVHYNMFFGYNTDQGGTQNGYFKLHFLYNLCI